MNESFRHVRRGAILVGVVFCVAVVGHQQLTGDPWLESIYWTVITLSGVGYTQETPASVDMEELWIPETNRLVGQSIRSADLRQHHQMLIIAIRREDGQLLLTPEAEQKFHPRDTVIVLGQEEGITQFRRAYDIPLASGGG